MNSCILPEKWSCWSLSSFWSFWWLFMGVLAQSIKHLEDKDRDLEQYCMGSQCREQRKVMIYSEESLLLRKKFCMLFWLEFHKLWQLHTRVCRCIAVVQLACIAEAKSLSTRMGCSLLPKWKWYKILFMDSKWEHVMSARNPGALLTGDWLSPLWLCTFNQKRPHCGCKVIKWFPSAHRTTSILLGPASASCYSLTMSWT